MISRRACGLLSVILAFGLSWPGAAGADWLVTVDGDRIETDGPWELEGRKVVFTSAAGTLSVIRASEVDMEASREATRVASEPTPVAATVETQAPPRPEPVLVLTNDDIAQAQPEGEGESGDEPSSIAQDPDAEPVQLVAWRHGDRRNGDGIEIRGTVRNAGNELASGIQMSIEVKDEEDRALVTADVNLDSRNLLPGQTTAFKVDLPGVYDLPQPPEFTITSAEVSVGATQPPAADEDSDGAADVDEPALDDADVEDELEPEDEDRI